MESTVPTTTDTTSCDLCLPVTQLSLMAYSLLPRPIQGGCHSALARNTGRLCIPPLDCRAAPFSPCRENNAVSEAYREV